MSIKEKILEKSRGKIITDTSPTENDATIINKPLVGKSRGGAAIVGAHSEEVEQIEEERKVSSNIVRTIGTSNKGHKLVLTHHKFKFAGEKKVRSRYDVEFHHKNGTKEPYLRYVEDPNDHEQIMSRIHGYGRNKMNKGGEKWTWHKPTKSIKENEDRRAEAEWNRQKRNIELHKQRMQTADKILGKTNLSIAPDPKSPKKPMERDPRYIQHHGLKKPAPKPRKKFLGIFEHGSIEMAQDNDPMKYGTTEIDRINYQFDEVFSRPFANPFLAVHAARAILERFSLNMPMLEMDGLDEEWVFEITNQRLRGQYLYLAISPDVRGHFDAYAQIVNEEELHMLENMSDEEFEEYTGHHFDEIPESEFHPSHFLVQARHSAED